MGSESLYSLIVSLPPCILAIKKYLYFLHKDMAKLTQVLRAKMHHYGLKQQTWKVDTFDFFPTGKEGSVLISFRFLLHK